MKVTRRTCTSKVQVLADDTTVVSLAGSALLVELADRLGLTDGLGVAMAPTRERPSTHDPGRVLCDVAVMLAGGGDCLADLGALRDQPGLFGQVASDSTAFRVIDSVDAERLERIRAARARARERAWAAGARPTQIILDIDSTLVTAHSDKDGAAPTYKRGYGFHPMLCYLGGEALAGMLRPGNAGANTAADHIGVLVDALDQLPEQVREARGTRILVRTDSAGCTHDFLQAVVEMECSFSVSMPIDQRSREVILALPDRAWTAAIGQDATVRDGAWVAELGGLDLSGWPAGARAICRLGTPGRHRQQTHWTYPRKDTPCGGQSEPGSQTLTMGIDPGSGPRRTAPQPSQSGLAFDLHRKFAETGSSGSEPASGGAATRHFAPAGPMLPGPSLGCPLRRNTLRGALLRGIATCLAPSASCHRTLWMLQVAREIDRGS